MDWQNMSVKEVTNNAGRMGAQITMYLKQPKPNNEGAVAVYKELVAALNSLKSAPVVSQKAKLGVGNMQASKFTTSMPANARGVQPVMSEDPGTQKIEFLQKIVDHANVELKQHKVKV